MSETLFIADLHLDPKRPTPLALCLDFLAGRARQAEALYILGDLFEVWLGDDEDEPTYQQVLTALHNLTASGVPVFIMHGNRDFLLGEGFVAATGCQLLDEDHLIDLYGTPTLLMHGDSLCTLDVEYQAFRQQVRNPQWQKQFLAQPLAQRRRLAQQARAYSQTKAQNTAEAIMDVTPEAVISAFLALEKPGVYHLIHGHTHRPAVHQLTVNGQTAYRRVVGDWRDNSAVILICAQDGCQLVDLLA
ncbi:MAG TPA: UDP-2,3-diacylglucosamine diphosphatase [Thioploca sp.]|nr:MAG: UDP-2,3-diacylglucosamine diphosphatase [Beggiatoa sp. 4572_84]RKZ60819.1 MAG: UDP-2,3-diacylglucosamine diphosphatase [Gammaproteobacteria bacterium]HDN25983.1 UDP-2,3-diacylglucosamine diphosphatase [Thioploca sp.]